KVMINGVIGYEQFHNIIKNLSDGKVSAHQPEVSTNSIRDLINLHPLISPIEIKDAFSLRDLSAVKALIQPLLDSDEISIKPVHNGWFIQQKK
ncbi:TPA: hypothetical protein ACU8OC_003567, partial [Klebsiella pneumoniae]